MKNSLVLMVSLVCVMGASSAVAFGCGGPDKPPMLPDTTDPTVEAAEAGASPSITTAPPTPGSATPPIRNGN